MFYPGEKSTTIASIETITMHWNSVASSSGARHVKIDLNYFYLKLGLLEYEHARIKTSTIPENFAKECELHDLMDAHGHVYVEV